MSENREHKRKETNAHIGIYDLESNRLIGCLIDLTIVGMRVMVESEAKPGCQLGFSLMLPLEINNLRRLKIEAECVWCNISSDPKFYSVGFKFLNITDEIIDTIVKLLESPAFKEIKMVQSTPV